ncbi:Ammonium transporter Rh type B [Phytophthora fragariae]|uniref:Ammonium transporter Rh type B n=4 Tax=Phytophthora fragariae TaxID=53985 RepID=A0A6A3YFG8_9STRA|nr:Ammonium transporter Rh type B [Phytophthora fragariae]KAE9072001.1 Ammonium transporter Rh type B [Phytophthora fragariae]KAE9119001.1 Ammonium transporter Rh type B [Phytophthora fragariae]KAE9147676.1 Ammonium transporter Rh type B [Phytophthora fragariae]KAE9182191.1 Ammonium transporter Rh type B [Phytophthora fragariae]
MLSRLSAYARKMWTSMASTQPDGDYNIVSTPNGQSPPTQEKCFALSLILFEAVCLIFFALKFDMPSPDNNDAESTTSSLSYYPMYMDVHVMIYIGFGFLMTFLRKYSMSAVSLNFLIGVLSLQWGIIMVTMAHQIIGNEYHTKILDIPTMINGDFAAGAVLISFGAVLGKITPTQLVWMTFLEIIFYAINEYIVYEKFLVTDAGGSMVIHTFGAFFGLAVTMQLGVPTDDQQVHNTSRYHSDVFAMIGTLFLWMYWPSFNAALVSSDGFQQERAVMTTVLSIAASCASAFAATKVFSHTKKFDMVHVQNATLAGGVAMGTSCNLAIGPAAAITVGLVVGVASVLGFSFVTPGLERVIRMSDTCGILNLHGMPGVVGGLAGAIITFTASDSYYGDSLTDVYSARAYRSANEQGGYQLLAIATSVGIGAVSGFFVGYFLKSSRFRQQKFKYEDEEWFHVPEEESHV